MPTLILTATLLSGIGSQYAPGVFERVVAYRQRLGQIPQNTALYAGFVAVPECGRIGEALWVRPVGGEFELMLVADCAGRSDARESDGLSGFEWMERNGVLVEVDYPTAYRWRCVNRAIRVETASTGWWRRGGPKE